MLGSQARRAFMLACGAAVVLATAPAAALAVPPPVEQAPRPASPQTSALGIVTATFRFTVGRSNTYPTKTLTISRAGQVVYHQSVTSKYCGGMGAGQKYCTPGLGGSSRRSVHVVNLEPGGEPDVVLDLYTGGAHCCTIEQVFSFAPGLGTYVKSERDFGDPGARLLDLGPGARDEFLTADDTFAYAFTDFASSGLPIKVLSFAGGRFTDVTRHYPRRIAKDAAMYLNAFKHDIPDGDGLIAAWAADEDNLGHTKLVASTLAKYLKAGELHGSNYATGQKFIKALNKLLKKDGYVH